MKKWVVLITTLLLISTFFVGCTQESENKVLNVYHAGSLSIPFDEMEKKFEEEHSNVDVRLEGAGSVATVRKVTDQGKTPDIVAVADYSLISDFMYDNDKADWTVRFANNRMVIAYTEQSNHKDMVNEENWYEILNKHDVKFGFSNPNDDPCGYRSQMVTLLAENHYSNDTIYDALIESNTAIIAEGNHIIVPEDLEVNTDKIMVRSAEVDLMSALEAGEIDYLFIYQSVAEQHEGVKYTQLPEEIDLSSVNHTSNYNRVTLTRASGEKAQGKPIVYGITIPNTVKNKEIAIEFMKMLLEEEGQNVMESMGQPPIVPAQTDNKNAIPDDLKNLVEES
ncbi:MAG: tungstate ABC transporter substrate-binding protein WtpA [Thermoplasmatota archaeon]